mmetsp:Transcript_2517/g.7383  ORF Transcript_2517/g.7383 Transcript_2517/m.7383 type:complete len:219 (-) Transcript_2517:149-805(-)
MKLSASLLALFAAASAPAALGSAVCKEKCQTFPAVLAQFAGNGGSASGLAAYKYGRYCGAANFDRTGREPCNAIDAACQEHDSCYAANQVTSGDIPIPADPDSPEQVMVNARCTCNNIFIASLLAETTQAFLTGTGGNCGDNDEEICDCGESSYNQVADLQVCLFCLIQLEDATSSTTATCTTADYTSILPTCQDLYATLPDGEPIGPCAIELAKYSR